MAYVTITYNGQTYQIPAPGEKSANWGTALNQYLVALSAGVAANGDNNFTGENTFSGSNTYTTSQYFEGNNVFSGNNFFEQPTAFDERLEIRKIADTPAQTANYGRMWVSSTDGDLYYRRSAPGSSTVVNLSTPASGAPVYSGKQENYTILTSDNGTRFSNWGAEDSVTFTLPTAAAGLEFYFTRVASSPLTIIPSGGDFCYSPTDSGTVVLVASDYSSCKLACHSEGIWVIEAICGTIDID